MSNHGKTLLRRIYDLFSRVCPNCGHDADIHWLDECLGAIEANGRHVRWCDCTSLRKKGKK